MTGEWPEPGDVETVATGRYHAVAAVALAGAALGLVLRSPPALLAGALGVAVVAYARLSGPPPVEVTFERSLSPADPDPGDEVTVSLTVTNAGEGVLPDVAVHDGVPDGAEVLEGPPRLATALRAGEAATVEYAVRAPPGEAPFEPPLVVARGVAAAVERAERVAADGATSLGASPSVESPASLSVRTAETGRHGPRPLPAGGEGVSFFAVREYRRGDPPSCIDWARAARTGELSTVTHRESQAVRVVVVVDARHVAHVAPGPGAPTAVARGVEAAGTVAGSLLSSGALVGLAALSPRDCWLPPGRGDGHRERLRRRLAGDPALATAPPDERTAPGALVDGLLARLRGGTQVVLLTPLVDDGAREAARRLEASGYPVTVVSPDVTTDGTPGRTLAAIERRTRVRALRAAGLPVVDWPAHEDLARTLARRGWSR
jgi:uncharacterized protein (DUF58 family)